MTAELPPDDATLRRFLLGDLPPADLEAVAHYLDAHPSVATTLFALKADDTLVSALRGPAEATDPPEVAAAVARAAALVGGEPTTASRAPAPIGDATADAVSDAVAAVTDADDADDPLAALAPPEAAGELGRLGGYRVLRLLGRGGMGAVFEAADDRLARRVALKVMLPTLAAKASARQRFLREAKAAAAVEHDHIVPIYQTGEDRGVPFLAMPLLAGETLDARLTGARSLPAADVLRVGREVAEGLAAAHAAGLVHRDIKPSNVWLERTADGAFKRVRILDFGLARSASGADGLTQSGAVLGTPAYMAPEQARGEAVDARADLFSLGVVLYHAATGRRPFLGNDTFSVLTALATTDPQPAATVNPAVPAGLSALITRLLAKNPAGRPTSARAVADELARLAAEPPRDSATQVIAVGSADRSGAGDDTTEAFDAAPPRRRARRGWKVAAAVLFLAVAGLAAANGPTIVRVVSNEGELVVEVDDPATEVAVKGGAVELRREDGGKKRVYLVTATKAGEVEVREPGSDAVLVTEKFQLRRGGDVLVKVTADKLAAARRPKAAPAPAGSDADQAAARFVLSVGGKVRVVVGENETLVEADGQLPQAPFRLVAAHFYSTRVTDEDLGRLRAAASLTRLGLEATGVSDRGLEQLKEFKTLSYLNLQSTKITNAGLAHLAGLTGLRELSLHDNGDRIDDAGMKHLTRLTALRALYVGGTSIGDAGLEQIKGLPTVEELMLRHTKVTDTGLAMLPAMGSLKVLLLDGSPVTDAGLEHLQRVKTLTSVELSRTKVTETGVKKLAAARPDVRIVWDGPTIEPKVSPAPLTPAQQAALEWVLANGGHLELRTPAGTPLHLRAPSKLPDGAVRVSGVSFGDASKHTEAALLGILRDLPAGVRDVHLNYAPLTDAGLDALVGLPSMGAVESFTASGARVTDDGLRHLRKLPRLRGVGVGYTGVTAAGLAHLRGLPLTNLGVHGCPVDDAAMDTIAGFRELDALNLSDTRVTAKGMAALRALPKLNSLLLGGSTATADVLEQAAGYPLVGYVSLNAPPVDAVAKLARFPRLDLAMVYWPDAPLPAGAAEAFAACRRLKVLDLGTTRVTRAEMDRLAAAMPWCEVKWAGGSIPPAAPR